MTLPFHHALKRFILMAFSGQGASPDELAERFCRIAMRPCDRKNAELFNDWLVSRNINRLVHFTAIQNVPKILKLGLIPRKYLELDIVRLSLNSVFSDGQRYDGLPEYNCLSITSPNYKMFYQKRSNSNMGWAVVTFDPRVLTKRFFQFTPTNAASSSTIASAGVLGAEKLFQLEKLRQDLQLNLSEPTDPQAEALCDSILSPEFVMEVIVQNETDQAWLARYGISSTCDHSFFEPRKDWKFWQRVKKVTDLPEFAEVK